MFQLCSNPVISLFLSLAIGGLSNSFFSFFIFLLQRVVMCQNLGPSQCQGNALSLSYTHNNKFLFVQMYVFLQSTSIKTRELLIHVLYLSTQLAINKVQMTVIFEGKCSLYHDSLKKTKPRDILNKSPVMMLGSGKSAASRLEIQVGAGAMPWRHTFLCKCQALFIGPLNSWVGLFVL